MYLGVLLEAELLRLMDAVQRVGVWPAVLAWITAVAVPLIMAYVLRTERRRAVWVPAFIVGSVALVANLADYVVTLSYNPDLSLEVNPLWRNVVDHFGLTVAKWYGLTGKICISIAAGQMFAFYLVNRERLFPPGAASLPQFLVCLGTRSATFRERIVALFTVFAFFFAGVQLFYFYIAYVNSLVHSELRNHLPSVPLALFLLLGALTIAFVAITYRDYAASSPKDEKIA
ncbi:MAG: hypothetical protein ACE5MM_01625 [Nitrospiraceae bacterium]